MDKQQFQQQVLSAEQMLYRVSKTLLFNDSDCADAVQEAILRAWAALPTLREERYFTTWLVRILINECHRINGKKSRIVSIEAQPDRSEPPGDDNAALYEALCRLPEKIRMTVELHYIEGYPVEDTAKILGVPVGTVKSRLSSGRKQLKSLLEE
ncbi:MAG: RNA polymerase sigma factor [Clostridia bacterium]|nr:RNA polymerase sigma factor [Clostridia bacterium]